MLRSLSALVLVALAIGCSGSASSSADPSSDSSEGAVHAAEANAPTRVAPSREAPLKALPNLLAAHLAFADVDVAVLEIAGGDVAMNPTHLWVRSTDTDMSARVWDTGLAVNAVTSVEAAGPMTVKITGSRDTLDEGGAVKSVPFTATVRLAMENEALASTITVESDAAASGGAQPQLLRDEDVGIVGYVDDVRLPENAKKGDESIRLFDTFGGDPAMNGHQLDLVVASGDKSLTYELGLNVASVKTFRLDGTDLVVGGTQDTLDADGNVTSQPFEARIKRGGALGDAVEVSRTH